MPTRPPPSANRNNLKQTPIPVVSRTMPIVNPDGTVTRSGQLLLEQLQAPTTIEGSHANRPDPSTVPDGAIYVEFDRGSIYCNLNGTWQYITGTMWATLSPDLRPTDLGTYDGGFDFRTTDDPAREFIWSQTEWIEATPVRFGTHAQRLAVVIANVIDQMLWIETDRGNVVYQVQSGSWKYVAGAMKGTIIAVDQRPTDLGANDTGFLFLSSDSTSVEWGGGSWNAIMRLVDLGPAPPESQLVIKANGQGAISLTNYAVNNGTIGFDSELDLTGVGNWKALSATCAWIVKNATALNFNRVSGATPGTGTGQITVISINLATGQVTISGTLDLEAAGVLEVGGQTVVGPRRAAVAAPSGGSTIDAQARTAIQQLINSLSAAAGGHGLIA